jgi:hypothetical protein
VKERNPDFNIKSSAAQDAASTALPSARWSGPQTRNRWLYLQHRGPSADEAGRNASAGQEQRDTE